MHIIESAVRQLPVKLPETETCHSRRKATNSEQKEKDIAREILLLIKCISYYPKNSRKISILEWLTFH